MRKTILVVAAFAMLTACKKKSEEITIPEKLSENIELVVEGEKEEKPPLYQASETYNYLGFGYDVTDRFNDEASIRASVVDVAAFDASGSYKINFARGTEGSWTTIHAKDAVDLSARFSDTYKPTRGLNIFGNTIDKIFPGTVATDKKYAYGYYSNYMVWKSYEFYYDEGINGFLTAGFKRDVTLLNAQELVQKYGTHVLGGIRLGAKFDVVYQAEVAEGNREFIVLEGLRYALKRTFGLMSGYLDKVNLANLNANSSARIYYSSIGGDSRKLKLETLKDRQILNITDWRSTTTEDNARFIGVYKDNLIPLDALIDDNVKKAVVKSYLEQYLAAGMVKLTN